MPWNQKLSFNPAGRAYSAYRAYSYTKNETFWTVFLNANNKDALRLATT